MNLHLLIERQMTHLPLDLLKQPDKPIIIIYDQLPETLETLIEITGQYYKADPDEMRDMKHHVLHFINTQPQNLKTALLGFEELKSRIEIEMHFEKLK